MQPVDSADAAPIAAIRYGDGGPIDELLRGIADDLAAAGLRLGGLVQQATVGSGECCATLALRDLRDGTVVTISQDLGAGAAGCRLDPAALADVARRAEDMLDEELDLMVLNRFGRSEAEGGGLRAVIQTAAVRGIPVLTAVRAEHAEAWARFHGGLGVDLPADRDAVVAWCRRAARGDRAG